MFNRPSSEFLRNVSAPNSDARRGILRHVRTQASEWIGRRVLLASAVLTVACAAAPRAPGLWASSVEHLVAIDRAGIDRDADGRLRLETDLGHTVLVARAYVVQAQAQLVDCLAVGGDVWDDWLALRSWLSPGLAYAGHSESAEPSAVIAPLAIDLVHGADAQRFGTAAFGEARYCRSHFLVAGLGDASAIAGAPDDVDLAGLSLYVEAEVLPETPGEAPRSVTIASTLSDGAITDLPDALVSGLDGSHARLTVTRDVARMFDGLALDDATLDEDTIARAVLARLDHEARVTLEVTSAPIEEAP